MKIEVDIWDMKNGIITGLKYGDNVFMLNNGDNGGSKSVNVVSVSVPMKRYPNMIDRWIMDKHVNKFNVDDFIKSNIKHRYEKSRLSFYLSKMVEDRTLTQVGNDVFVVNTQKGVK